MNRFRHRWLIIVSLVLAVWLIWSRLRVVFVVRLDLWALLLVVGLLALGIYMALKQLRVP